MYRFLFLIPILLFLLGSCRGTDTLVRSGDTADPPTLETRAFSDETAISASAGCFETDHLSADDLRLADSLLYRGLQNEALHTLISDLKPMSDVASFTFFIQEPDSLGPNDIIAGSGDFLEKFGQLQRVSNAIQCGTLSSALFPFRNLSTNKRYIQFRVFRQDAANRIIEQYPEFWSRWGFTRDARPELMIQVMEYEEVLDRFRGYGYLYGYPSHAVDFFVYAADHHRETDEFVRRDFIQVPVASGQSGRFVYAVEVGHVKNEEDQHIYSRASENVQRFMEESSGFYREDGTFRAMDFLRHYHTNSSSD